jgi:inhibitor of KinA
VASPGGWRIIGRTPWRLFDAGRPEPFRLLPGDLVRFEAIDKRRFRELAERWER